MPEINIAVLFLTILLVAVSAKQINDFPDSLKSVLKKYDKPSPNNVNSINLKNIRRSSSNNFDMKEKIRKKITELMPVLDDDKRHEKVGKENNEEPLIYSIHKDHLDTANQKYRKLRKEIQNMLRIEPISNETVRIVTDALDQIESELKNNECVINKIEGDVLRRGHSYGNEPSIIIPKNMENKAKIMKHIKEKWEKVVNQYSVPKDSKTHNDTVRRLAFVFLTRLRQFVFDIHSDYLKLQDMFGIKCVSDKTRTDVPIFKQSNMTLAKELEKDDACTGFTICSAELLDFFADFYNQMNETCTEVFRNYIEMYLKEVKVDNDERESFTSVVELIQDHALKKIEKMFIKQIEALTKTLNTSSRIHSLRSLIDKTIEEAKELIYASLSMKLKTLKPKLRLTVKQDIDIAAGIELGNIQKIFKDKMCVAFQTCNGVSRKSNTKKSKPIDPNSIKIRLSLGLDNKTKKKQKKYRSKSGHEKKHVRKLEKESARKINIVQPFHVSEYKYVNVTRTTYADFIEKGTTTTESFTKVLNDNATESVLIYF